MAYTVGTSVSDYKITATTTDYTIGVSVNDYSITASSADYTIRASVPNLHLDIKTDVVELEENLIPVMCGPIAVYVYV